MQRQRPEREAAPQKKGKRPVTAGKAFALGLLASFFLLLIFSLALAVFAVWRTQAEEAAFNQMLSDAKNEVLEASVDVAFSPAPSIRAQALDPSVAIEVEVDTAAAAADAAQTPNAPGDPHAVNNGNPADNNAPVNGDMLVQQNNDPNSLGNNPEDADTSGTTGQGGDRIVKKTVHGSGVIMNKDGHILTNYHVIQNAKNITVIHKGVEYDARVTGVDESSDLAMIKIEGKDLPVAKIGTSETVATGDFVMAVGNPYGLEDSMSTGIISAVGRDMSLQNGKTEVMYANMFQTDVQANLGNSGGGLYNAHGELIGLNTLLVGEIGSAADDIQSDSVVYAIPVDFIIPIAKQLMDGQPASHASLGISISDVPRDVQDKFGLEDGHGAYITSVTPSGPAETAGIVKEDIIDEYNGERVEDAQDLLYKVRASKINEMADVKILREGREMNFSVKLGADV